MASVGASFQDTGQHCLELNNNPIRFEPGSKLTNVFFDDANRQVFAVRSGGATGVVVKGPDEKFNTSFRMEDKGDVISIKFSPNQKVLAIQRCQTSIEFVNFSKEIDSVEYSQTCKGKSTKILGFTWTCVGDVVFVTDHGIELYQVIPEKRLLKPIKSYSQSVNWFVYMPGTSILLLASGSLGNQMQPYQFKPGNVYKLPKFEVDLPIVTKSSKICLLERDVIMADLYGNTCIVVLRHQPRGMGNGGAEIAVYTLQKESPARKTHILKLDMSGRFAVNVVDNLVIVHHQASKTSMLFDINLPGESDGYVTYHYPVTAPLPIHPFKLKVPVVPTQGLSEPAEIMCELYSPNWIVFQPNIIIDAKLGCLWNIKLRLDVLVQMIPDKLQLVDLLMLRHDAKSVLLDVLRQSLMPGHQASLATISRIFGKLNTVYSHHQDCEIAGQGSLSGSRASVLKHQIVIEQSDMYTHVFSVFVESKDIHYKFIVAVLLEYIRSLNQHQLSVQHYLYEPIINILVQHNCYYQLHQFLQYHVLSDSKPLACLLLSLESVYPPAFQLALDMLKRLSTANEEIIEVLLSKHQILTALRFVRSVGNVDNISARKFLEVAVNADDPLIFYSVYKFMEQRNIRLRGNPAFAKGEHCESYVQHFQNLFSATPEQ